MAEQRSDGGEGGAVADEFGGEGVPEGVGGGLGGEAYLFAQVLQDALGFAHGDTAVVLPDEDGRDRGGGEAAFGVECEELGHAGLGIFVQWDDPGPAGLGVMGGEVEFGSWLPVVGDLVDGETAGFTDAKAGVIDEPDQKVIPSPEGATEVDA